MADDNAISHLEVLRNDTRDEIKRRIEQRDKYSIQLTIALGAIVAVSFGTTGFDKVLIAAPLVSIYFTSLILYSYRIHTVLAQYLRDKIEPELSKECGTPPEIEFETYYNGLLTPGIRSTFFMSALWGVYLVTITYLYIREFFSGQTMDLVWLMALTGAAVIFLLANMWITFKLGRS